MPPVSLHRRDTPRANPAPAGPLHLAVSGLAMARRATGIGRYVRALLRGYAETFPEDALTIALPEDAADGEDLAAHPNVRCERVGHTLTKTTSRLRWELFALRTWAERIAPDVLFQPDFVLPLRALRRPVVVTIHDLAFRKLEASKSRAMRVYLHAAVRRAVRRAAGLIVHTRAVGDELVATYGARLDRLCVVEPPLEPRPTHPDTPELRAWRERVSGGSPYFLHLSNLDLRKNVDLVLDAFALHRRRGHRERLVLAGDGPRRRALEARARALGIADAVAFPGWIEDDQREALYRGATAFLFPSWFEGYGLPVVEAMARGVPVVTSTDGALAEAAGGAARLVDPRDPNGLAAALQALADDPALRRRLSTAGRDRASRTSPERSARVLREFLGEITRQAGDRC